MKKTILMVACLLMLQFARGQSYVPTITDSTSWVCVWSNFPGTFKDSLFIMKNDTNSYYREIWRVLDGGEPASFLGLVHQDENNAMISCYDPIWGITTQIMNLNLDVGEFFYFNENDSVVVDSVFYLDGKKVYSLILGRIGKIN